MGIIFKLEDGHATFTYTEASLDSIQRHINNGAVNKYMGGIYLTDSQFKKLAELPFADMKEYLDHIDDEFEYRATISVNFETNVDVTGMSYEHAREEAENLRPEDFMDNVDSSDCTIEVTRIRRDDGVREEDEEARNNIFEEYEAQTSAPGMGVLIRANVGELEAKIANLTEELNIERTLKIAAETQAHDIQHDLEEAVMGKQTEHESAMYWRDRCTEESNRCSIAKGKLSTALDLMKARSGCNNDTNDPNTIEIIRRIECFLQENGRG